MSFTELIKIIQEFEGIIGAIAGVVATLIVSHFLKNSGTIKTHQKDFKYTPLFDSPDNLDEWGNNLGGRVTGFEVKGTLLLENTSENMKAIHNIQLDFYTDSGLKSKELQDASTVKKSAGAIVYDTITHLNLPPKEITSVEVRMRADAFNIGYQPNQHDVKLVFEIADKKIRNKKETKLFIE